MFRSTLRAAGVLAAAAAALAAATPATALQFVQTRSVNVLAESDFSGRARVTADVSAQEAVSFDRFNPALGVLTGVTFTASGFLEHAVSISVPSAPALVYDSRGTADSNGRFAISSALFSLPPAFLLNPPAAQCDHLPVLGCNAHESASRTGELFSVTRSGDQIAAFVGLDPFQVNTTSRLQVFGRAERPFIRPPFSVGWSDWRFDTGLAFSRAAVDFTLTYTYDARPPPPGGVPEPATWALMIGGFGLAGAALRRRHTLLAP